MTNTSWGLSRSSFPKVAGVFCESIPNINIFKIHGVGLISIVVGSWMSLGKRFY